MGFLANYFAKNKAKKQHVINVQEFTRALFAAAQDGVLTDQEIADLEAKKLSYGITDAEITAVRVQVYNSAFSAITTPAAVKLV